MKRNKKYRSDFDIDESIEELENRKFRYERESDQSITEQWIEVGMMMDDFVDLDD